MLLRFRGDGHEANRIADAVPSDGYTSSLLCGMTLGPHKIRVELVNANHEGFPGQSEPVMFTIPKGASRSHSH